VEESIWKGGVRKNAHKKTMGSCNRIKERICAKERKGVLIIKEGKRGSTSICRGPVIKRVYLAIEIATDLTSPFCSEEG